MGENTSEQLGPSQSIRQWQVTVRWGFVGDLPRELVWERPVIELLDLRVELLHPPELEEQLREVFAHFIPYFLLHAVPEFVLAVFPPQGVDVLEVGGGDELDLGEEDVAALLGGVAGQKNEEAAGLLVGLPEVLGGEVLLQEVVGDAGLGSGGGGGGRGGRERETGSPVGKRGSSRGDGSDGGGGGRSEEERRGRAWAVQ